MVNVRPCAHGKIHGRSKHTTHRIITIGITGILEGGFQVEYTTISLELYFSSPRKHRSEEKGGP